MNRFLNQFCRRSKSRFKSAFIVCVALILCSGLPGQQTIAGELDGSRASFLLDYKLSESSLNYLSYEMSDERRSQFRQRLKGLGDTHIYLYTQNSADDFLPIGYRTWFRDKLIELNSANLKPVLWLTADGSPNITSNVPAWKSHVSAVIDDLDDQVAGYVLCLECDEYWDSATVYLFARLCQRENGKAGGHPSNSGGRGPEFGSYLLRGSRLHLPPTRLFDTGVRLRGRARRKRKKRYSCRRLISAFP